MVGRLLLVAFTFLAGYELCLPVVPEDSAFHMPYFATPLGLPGGLSLKELLLVIHAFLNIPVVVRMFRVRRMPFLLFVYYLFFTAAAVSIAVNSAPDDLPEAARFLAAGYYVFAVQAFIERYDVESLVAALLLGIIASMLINLYLTFTAPRAMLGLLPLLYGQNGPGGFAGVFVGLSFLLRPFARGRMIRTLLLTATLTAGFTVLLSYSKLGITMAVMGAVMWIGTFWVERRSTVGRVAALSALIVASIVSYLYLIPTPVKEQAGIIYEYKFYNQGEGYFDTGDLGRWAYYLGVGEVLLNHPLGVSYRGIGGALQRTHARESGYLPTEDSLTHANPHNSFLYYMAANGYLGWLATILFFIYFMVACYRHLSRSVLKPAYYAALLFGICVLFTNTLPTFFNVFFFESLLLYMIFGSPTENHFLDVPSEAGLLESMA